MTKAKQILFVDENTYTIFKQRENDFKATVKELMTLAETALGIDKVTNLKEYLNNPAEFLVNQYWLLYCKDYPQHLDRENVFLRDLGISIENLSQIKFRLQKQMNDLQQYAPTVNESGIEYKVKEADFNRYLDKSKAEHYNALKTFVDASKQLNEHEPNCKPLHLIRYSDSLIFKGLEVEINNQKFIM